MRLDPPFWKTMIAVGKTRWRSDLFKMSALIAALTIWQMFFKAAS
jgi:hypothetical protein